MGIFGWLPGHGAGLEKVVRDCAEARCKYTELLGAATGEDVIRYLVVLNCIECQGYVAETKIQAHRSFGYLIVSGGLGFLLMTGGVVAMMLNLLDSAALPVGAGVIMQLVSGIFVLLHRTAGERMERFHDSLRSVQETVLALYIRGLLGDETRDEKSREIISVLIGAGTKRSPEGKDVTRTAAETQNHEDRRASPLIAVETSATG